jgi:hypothetical protein
MESIPVCTRRHPGYLILLATLIGTTACSAGGLGPFGQSKWTSYEDYPPRSWPAAVQFRLDDPLRAQEIHADTTSWIATIRASDGLRSWVVEDRDLRPLFSRLRSPWYRTHDTDSLRVEVRVRPVTGGPESLPVEVKLPLRNDYFWWVSVSVTQNETCQFVIACRGVRSVALDPGESELRLWVSWGWGRISHPNVVS